MMMRAGLGIRNRNQIELITLAAVMFSVPLPAFFAGKRAFALPFSAVLGCGKGDAVCDRSDPSTHRYNQGA